jgi:hypothetical protein
MSALPDAARDPSRTTPTHRAAAAGTVESEAWRIPGLVAGLIGAAVVALIFLVIDLAAGRPMWTPSALGARLFRGRTLDPQADWIPILTLGYTLVHGVVFIGLGSIAAYAVSVRAGERRPSVLLVTLGLFLAIEGTFVALALGLDPDLLGELGAGPVAVANLVAAAAMAAVLHRSRTLAVEPGSGSE